MMTGEKNRFKTHEKLWNLDDKQLTSPKHDAMVLWLMDEDNLRSICKDLFSSYPDWKFIKKNEESIDKIDIESEVPLLSSPTFIGGYADLIIHRKYYNIVEEHPCPIPKEYIDEMRLIESIEDMQRLINDYLGHNKRTFKKFNEDVNYGVREGYIDKYGYFRGSAFDIELERECYVYTNYTSSHRGALNNYKLFDFVCNVAELPPHIDAYNVDKWVRGDRYAHIKREFISLMIEVKPYVDSFGAVLRQIKSYQRFKGGMDYYCLFTADTRFDKQFESQGIKVLHPPIPLEEIMKEMGFQL